MYYVLIISLAVGLVALLMLKKKNSHSTQSGGGASSVSAAKSVKTEPVAKKQAVSSAQSAAQAAEVAQNEDEQEWNWEEESSVDLSTDTSVSAQEVDPLTEYQVYKQFGYEDKAAESLFGYFKTLNQNPPEKLLEELLNLTIRSNNLDMLTEVLEKYSDNLPETAVQNYVRSALMIDNNHLGLRVFADSKLGWDMQEVERQISNEVNGKGKSNAASRAEAAKSLAEQIAETQKAAKRSPLVLGQAKINDISDEEIGAIIGFVRPEKTARILKEQGDYDIAIRQYDKAIQESERPASLIIDALKLDYQHENVDQFARHLWKLYYTLGQNGRQVKERMLGWGYNLGSHEVFDELSNSSSEQQIREVGIEKGYLRASSSQMKAKYRDLVSRDDSMDNESGTPAEMAMKEVESLFAYGQIDQALDTLEKAILEFPEESQLYIVLFDLYERSEDWERFEKFLRTLREQVSNLPEEVVLAMSQLLQRVNRVSK